MCNADSETIEALDNDVLILARELRDKNAENAKLRAALTDLLWYVGQLEPLVYSADDSADHYTVANARAALQ